MILRFSGEVAKSTASGTPIRLISGLPLSCSCTMTRMNAGLDPVRALRLQARPAEAAQALHLVLLDRQRDLARAGIAGDLADLRAGQVVEHRRIVAGRGAGLARSDQELLRQRVLEGFHRRVGARNADVVVGRGRAEVDEFGRVVPQLARAAEQRIEQRVHHGAVLQRADVGAVLGATLNRCAAAVLLPAPGMLVTTMPGLPGMCFGMWRASSRA